MKSLIVFALIAIVICTFAFGVYRCITELRAGWAMLRSRFGTSNEKFESLPLIHSVLGKLEIFDLEYVGSVFVAERGILFRHIVAGKDEHIHIPIDEIEDFVIEPDGRAATFAIRKKIPGENIGIRIPWSAALSRHWYGI